MSSVTPADFNQIISKITKNKKGTEQTVYLSFLFQNYATEDTYKEDVKIKILKTYLSQETEFFAYLDQVIAEAGVPDQILQSIEHVYHSAKLILDRKHNDKGGLTLNPKTAMATTGTVAIARSFEKLSPETLLEIAANAGKLIVDCEQLGALVKPCFEKLKIVGPRAGPVLALTYLTYEGVMAIYHWSKGEITGNRCVQIIVTSASSVAAAYCGGVSGGAAAALLGLGPYGVIIASLAAGIAASTLAAYVAERVTLWCFDMPKDQAEEKAYNYLGVTKSSSASEVNAAFYALCRTSHPDKPGGSHESFVQLQVHMNVIRAARGELGR